MGRKEEDIFIRFKIKVVVKEEVKAIDKIITRLRLGYAALNYSRVNKHESGTRSLCGLAETVEHVLINCTAYKNERKCLVGELKEMGIGNITIKKS